MIIDGLKKLIFDFRAMLFASSLADLERIDLLLDELIMELLSFRWIY
jgi:hypothetical protein